ncbi:MAG: hypothetical protein EXR62_08625 [Chloroflexi bacterium]|nr:hypothetical protein [Chloroflexota bacterium]
MSQQKPFTISATVDFPDDCYQHVYTPQMLDEMIDILASLGVTKINWLYYGSVAEGSFWSGPEWGTWGSENASCLETVRILGEPLKAAVPIIHKHGMQVFSVIKPYATGLSASIFEGSPFAQKYGGPERIGGPVAASIPFIRRDPQLRVARRPGADPQNLSGIPVTRIKLRKNNASPTRLQKENLEVWVSEDNCGYARRVVELSLHEEIELASQDFVDYDGRTFIHTGDPLRTLTLEGLYLTDKYILISTNFSDHQGDFRNSALAMLEVYGPDGLLPVTVATGYTTWYGPCDFRTSGLQYDTGLGSMPFTLDVDNHPVLDDHFPYLKSQGYIAFARGRNQYLPNAPCEAYPEVQQLWLDWVDESLQAGVDGIDFRISGHSTLTDWPTDYGFNQVILDAYRQRYHEDPGAACENVDLVKLAQLRGETYSNFLREARSHISQAGKPMYIHLHTEAFRENIPPGAIMGFPANMQFDWQGWLQEGLVDGITLRTSWFEACEAEGDRRGKSRRGLLPDVLADPVITDAIQTVTQFDLPIYLTRYIDASTPEFYPAEIDLAYSDGRFNGFDLYEGMYLCQPDSQGHVKPAPQWTIPIKEVVANINDRLS